MLFSVVGLKVQREDSLFPILKTKSLKGKILFKSLYWNLRDFVSIAHSKRIAGVSSSPIEREFIESILIFKFPSRCRWL